MVQSSNYIDMSHPFSSIPFQSSLVSNLNQFNLWWKLSSCCYFFSSYSKLPFIWRVIKANRKQATRHRAWGKNSSPHRRIIIRHHLKKQICAPTSSTNYIFFFNLRAAFCFFSLQKKLLKTLFFGWWHDAMLNKRKRTTNGNYEPHIWFVVCGAAASEANEISVFSLWSLWIICRSWWWYVDDGWFGSSRKLI